jgi:hypothetical protein
MEQQGKDQLAVKGVLVAAQTTDRVVAEVAHQQLVLQHLVMELMLVLQVTEETVLHQVLPELV